MEHSTSILLKEISTKLSNFEQSLDKSIDSAEKLREELITLFYNFKYEPPSIYIPQKFESTFKKLKKEINKINRNIYDTMIEHIRQERLIDRLKDYFLIVVVGRVKMGKSTLCNALADVFSKGLGKECEFFVLNEPTEEVEIDELKDAHSIYPPWAKKELSRFGIVYELLKESNFKMTPEIREELNKRGIRKVKIQIEGEPHEEKINEFETDILEATLEIQGMRVGKLCLLDAPGLASGNPYSRERAKDLWSCADLLIFLTSQDTPLQATDLRLIRELGAGKIGSILFCVTKCDRYIEDEVNGEIIRRTYFNAEDIDIVKKFIIREIKKAGLEDILVNPNIVGVSAKIYNDMRNESFSKALKESKLDEILKVLADTLSSKGLKRKFLKPLERIGQLTDKLIQDFESSDVIKLIEEFETKTELQKKILDSFEKRLIEEVNLLKKEKLKEAEVMANKKGEYELTIEASDWEKIMRKVAKGFDDDLVEYILKKLNLPEDIREKLRVKYENMTTYIRKKVGRRNIGSQVGGAVGGVIGVGGGARVGMVIGGSVGGPLGTLVGAVVGGIVGEFLGKEIGKSFDKDVYATAKITKRVRAGDNFKEVEEKLDKSISETLNNLLIGYHREIEALLGELKKTVESVLQEMNKRKKKIEKIKRKIHDIRRCYNESEYL